MCRLLAYVGKTIQLDNLLFQPQHSLVVQSYQPQEMTAGIVNADGFGIGWHHLSNQDCPYTYKNTLPIWSDINLPHIARYIKSRCFVGYVRSATPGLPVDLINCQPFTDQKLLFIHNGYIDNFRQKLYRGIRRELNDITYQAIQGNTDSEHIWALILSYLHQQDIHSLGQSAIENAVEQALLHLTQLALTHQTDFSANVIISDGDRLIASRYSNRAYQPSLYWIKNSPEYPDAVIVASEPMFEGKWHSCPENSILLVNQDLEIIINPIP